MSEEQAPVFNPEIHEESAKAHFESKGYVFKTAQEIAAEVASTEQTTAARVTNKAHEDWENALSDIFGTKRPDGVKGIDWAKKEISSLKTKQNPPDNSKDSQKDALIQDLKTKYETLSSQIESEKKQAKQAKIDSSLKTSVFGIDLGIKDEAELSGRRSDIFDILSGRYNFDIDGETGETIATSKKDGSPIMDIETSKPMDIDKLVRKDVGWMIPKETQKPKGSGTTQQKKNSDALDFFESKEAIFAGAREKGLISGSADWKAFIEKAAKASNVSL